MKMKKGFSIVLLIAMLSGIFGVIPTYAKELTIKDIQSTDEAYQTIQWVVNQGYMTLALGKFFPAKFVKRSEFAAIVTKLSGSGNVLENPRTPTFQDVTAKNQFYKQIETAKKYMVYYKNKTGKLFKPDSYITREDAVMSIVKVLGYDSDEALGSTDNSDVSLDDVIEDAGSINPSLVKYVAIGVINELMDLRTSGDKSYFDPKKNITRKDLAILIYNVYQKKDYTTEEIIDDNNNKTTPKDNGSKATPNDSNDKTAVNDTDKAAPNDAVTSSGTAIGAGSEVKPDPEVKLKIARVTASHSETPGTAYPEKMIDGDISDASYWTSSMTNVTVDFDLGASYMITQIKAAFYQAFAQSIKFDLAVSEDCISWTVISSGNMSKMGDTGLQSFPVNRTGRYLRIIGHGNTMEKWFMYTSINEVEIYGRQQAQ